MAVVGGGITGLTAAYHLATAADPPDVVLLEASERLGGKILTGVFAGLPVESGPDTILARVPWGLDLLQRLGFDDELVSPATGQASVWARGRLRPLPEGLLLGVPGNLMSLARSGVLSPAGLARAALDLVLPPSRNGDGDPSIAEAIGRRFGPELAEVLVEPLLSGINAGRADDLSLARNRARRRRRHRRSPQPAAGVARPPAHQPARSFKPGVRQRRGRAVAALSTRSLTRSRPAASPYEPERL